MSKSPHKKQTEALIASFKSIEKSYFWQEYTRALQTHHDGALTVVRTHADANADKLRVGAALCSAFHTALNLPTLMMQGAVELKSQEDMNNDDDA